MFIGSKHFTADVSSTRTSPHNVHVEIATAAVFSCQFVVESTTYVADVGLGGDEEGGHLERAATDDDEADDVALLLGQRLVGLVLGILLL